ncbi:MAG: LysR family transcriptional regulator [Peptococcaceae bacterium]|nr:LysR family transcriptional regulator [Peptococcaceae bacterium]
MRAEHIKYFIALAENHSITKTSLEFYTTHQSVSKIIRQLEEEMKAQLFVRSPKGMTLTPAGEIFLPVARETSRAFQQVRLDIAHIERQKNLEGDLLVWGAPFANAIAMPSLLEQFSALYPRVRYKIREANTLDCMQYISLHRDSIALVVIMHNEHLRDVYTPYIEQIHLTPFTKDEYICIVSAQSPLAKRKQISVNEMLQQPIAMLQTDISETHPLTKLLQRLGKIEPALLTQSRQLYGQLIASSRYVGFGSRRMSDFSLLFNDNDVVFVPFEEDLTIDIMLATNAQPEYDPVSQAFTALVQEQATQY